MTAELMHLLYQTQSRLKEDLDELQYIMDRKKKQWIEVEVMIQFYDSEADSMDKEMKVIDCVNIGEE